MALGKRIERKKTDKWNIKKIILYLLLGSFIISFISTIVISILLSCTERDMSIKIGTIDASTPESPVLGQFGPISTVILLIGIPFLILITTIAYAFYISTEGIKDELLSF